MSFVSEVDVVRDVQLVDATWRRSDDGTSVWIRPGQAASVDSYEELMQRFEYLSSMWETVAINHLECVAEETTAGLGQYGGFEFKCPIAAALLQCGLVMGVPAEVQGGWPTFKSSRARADWQPDRDCPPWATPVVVREQTRIFVRSAIDHLARVSEAGWSQAIWRTDFAPSAKTSTTSRGIFLSDAVSDAQLLKAVADATERCHRFQGPRRTSSKPA